ncbi:unnamed protein product [Effrenium voratum]|nr:unnamed protein product [Effrenium voratum]
MAGSSRQSVKQRGRPQACEALRERCLARVRLGREALLEKLRGQEGAEKGALRSLVREAVLDAQAPEEWLDEEALLALEEEIYLELRAEAERQAAEEEQQLTERQNAEDAALYEQHLLGGVACPLCSLGRLRVNAGTLVCSDCEELRVDIMDEQMSLDDISELLCLSEARHDHGGCAERGCFEASDRYGHRLLLYACKACGWRELVF